MDIQYAPLDPARSEIRLLRLVRRRPPNHDRLHFSMIHASRDEQPSYHALSYVWGDPARVFPIYVNGSLTYITQSLGEALARLYHEDIEFVWADGLCINQAEDDYALQERSSQVQQMRAIYRDADGVFAWLGPADDHSDIVMDEINNGGHNVFNRALQLFPNQIGKEATLDAYKLGRIALLHFGLDTLISDIGWESALLPASWKSWRAFLARPYWARL